ncbi:MAG: hypothetical protein QG567_2006 [Campylobacterota bacterium]|nr:hypothetical protein [Campylobacterota bacterium]
MKYDVCVIGSGAGGAPIAYELSLAGYSVAVLEKGKWHKEEEFAKDEILTNRRAFYIPKLNSEFHVVEKIGEDGKLYQATTRDLGFSFWNGSMVGGATNLMSGFFYRLKPDDFRQKTVYGVIEGANVVDWPIGYDELEPYYAKVEKIVGVSGRVQKHKFQEPRSAKDFAFEPTLEHPVSGWIDKACNELGFSSLVTPRAILPHDWQDRKGCSYSNFCGSYGCATGAKGSARASLIDAAIKTKKCTVLSEAFVYKLETDENRSVTKALYFDKNGKKCSIEAKIFVVAAGAIESVRLLLNSKNNQFLNGLANNNNQVGKNLIFSAGGKGEGVFELKNLSKKGQEELMVRGLFVNRFLQDWYQYKIENKIIKGGTIEFLFEHANPISRALKEVYDENSGLIWGAKLQEKIHYAFANTKKLIFEVFNDWLPNDGCFVSVDENFRDKWDVPVGKIRINSHKRDLEVGNFLAEKAKIVLEKMGAKNITSNISNTPTPNLVAGGCRFGDDPKTSVLDKNCKVHELKNLYVVDSSFMPTGGSVPYTWTIYANSFRVADEIKKKDILYL